MGKVKIKIFNARHELIKQEQIVFVDELDIMMQDVLNKYSNEYWLNKTNKNGIFSLYNQDVLFEITECSNEMEYIILNNIPNIKERIVK